MLSILATLTIAMLFQDNAEFIEDMNNKHADGYEFVYTGKHKASDIPNINADGYVWFSMKKEK